MKLVLFCWICVTSLHIFTNAMHKGEYRSVKDYPFMAQLYYEFEDTLESFCGVTILSEYWLISAAHCVGYEKLVKNQVRLGSSSTLDKGTLIDVEKFFVHGGYSTNFAWDNDIALIKLKTPIEFNEYQLPIQIGTETPKVGEKITVLGFGDYHHGVYGLSLRAAETSIINDEACIKSYKHKYSRNMICTNTKYIDLCFGDSGGPAVHDNKLIGIISQGCEYTEKNMRPNILTKVSNYYEWILQTTGIEYMD